ncbi:unnamed protein product [Anisakis simplex]|uniref:Putative zinc metalloproteinase (inferred by orthology to a C. elegans protein) n=1 Tax=Anisakis simplex TaxID=6269 RepID=A0A0M3JR58_ANISI|nr:unnamed protein product [Anisakis simplex]
MLQSLLLDPTPAKIFANFRRFLFGFSRLEVCLIFFSSVLLCSLIGVCVLWLVILQGYRQIFDGTFFSPIFLTSVSSEDNVKLAYDKSATHHNNVVCTSKECVLIAGFLAGNLNDKIDPCDDFYEFACGNYGLNRHLPASKPLRHTLSDMQTRLNKQVKKLLDSPITETDRKWDRLAKRYYKKCLQEEVLERNGVSAIRKLLRDLDGWPVLDGDDWREWSHSWEKQLAIVLNRTGVNAVIVELAVSHDPDNSSRSIIELDQPKWGVGSRWPYLTGPDDRMIQNYTSLMIQTAVNLGADRKIAERDMREAMEFELKLVNFSADEMVRRDPDRSNNPFQLWQLKDMFPYINFDEYIRTVFKDLVEITPNDTVIMREIEYFRGIQHVMRTTNKRTLSNYVEWRIVQVYSLFLPPTMREPFYEFKANQTGMFNSPIPERWEDCVFLSLAMLDMPVGKLYVEHYFDKERAMRKMTELTTYFKNELISQLHSVDWMDDMTKKRAIEKAKCIEYKSGFPSYIFNETWMNQNWGGEEPTDSEPLLQLTVRIKLARVADELVRLKKPVDRSIWFQSPAQVDAYYAPNLNEMIFPAGIMQFPFMSVGVPNYITYAMVGAVVGHEVSHAFDDQGGRYDKVGNLNDWWDGQTANKFYEKTECFIKQYEAVKVEEVGVHLNGRLSVGENIADNGGVKTALMAYKSWIKNTTSTEASLPGFQNFTSEQMFFLAYANVSFVLLSLRPKHYVQLIMTDVHAPSKYRAIVPLRNRIEFADAYHCAPGTPMNPVQKCAVW